jgi:hypothetical protein
LKPILNSFRLNTYHSLLFTQQELKICAAIIEIFHLIPAASVKMIEPLTTTMLKGEKELFIEVGLTFHWCVSFNPV